VTIPVADTLRLPGITLQGVACAGIKTCLMVPELKLMFDVAPSVAGQQKFNRVLVSHGHHDHLAGLPYACSQRSLGRRAPLEVHAPEELVPPMERIFEAWREILAHELPVALHGHAPGDTVPLSRTMTARCVRSVHRIPSLCWVVNQTVSSLDPKFAGLPGEVLAAKRKAGETIRVSRTADTLAVTGDTQIELIDREPWLWDVDVLVHEVTGWGDKQSVDKVRGWGHTHVDEIIERVERFTGKALVLVHRSARHSRSMAQRVVAERFPASVRDRVHVFG